MNDDRKPSPARLTVARNVRRLRSDLGLSQERLAEKAGLHTNYLGSVERGERNIGVDNIQRIADALGVTVVDLLAGGDTCP